MFIKYRMTGNPFTVGPRTTIPEAQALMATHGVRHLPVVDEGEVVGVISKNDIAAALPSQATTLSAAEATYLVSKLKVHRVMSKPALTISSGALLEEAAVIMRDKKIEMLPVVDDGRLVGVITESDILDSFIDILGFREHGTRLTVEARDEPGVLEQLTGITAAHDANITHLAVHRGNGGHSVVVVGLNTLNTEDIEADLAAAGMNVVATLTNVHH
ncbi:MAG TPA: CBS domain-containing protein [Arachnia sp.]|nr:CBS domain-containing protein [Arachnia sp.]HMT87511.1 CBS domain-containing protein [Arachnia sp.]